MTREDKFAEEVFRDFFTEGTPLLRSGDVVLFSYPKGLDLRSISAPCISHVQRSLLAELGYSRGYSSWNSRFTHAGLYAFGDEGGRILEMTTPKARIGRWEDVPEGTLVLVRRPGQAWNGSWREAAEFQQSLAANRGMDECQAGIPYPYRELLCYWVWHLWIGRLALGRRFRKMFADEERDVCSGSVWKWLCDAGLFRDTAGTMDALPEAWYPGRLAADRGRFKDIGLYRIVRGCPLPRDVYFLPR